MSGLGDVWVDAVLVCGGAGRQGQTSGPGGWVGILLDVYTKVFIKRFYFVLDDQIFVVLSRAGMGYMFSK